MLSALESLTDWESNIERVSSLVSKDDVHGAGICLSAIVQQGEQLTKRTVQLIQRLSDLQKYFEKKDQEALHNVATLHKCKSALEREKLESAKRLLDMRVKMRELMKDSVTSRVELSIAQTKQHIEERKTEIRREVINAHLGIVAGWAVNMVIDVFADSGEKEAQEVVLASARYQRAVANLERCNNDVEKVQKKLEVTERQLSEKEKEHHSLHQQLDVLREAAAFLRRALQHWKEFAEISKYATSRSDLFRKVIEKVHEKHSIKVLDSKGVSTQYISYKQIWAQIGDNLEYGKSNYVIAINYKCSKCENICCNLPFVIKDNLVCEKCACDF